MCKKVFVLNAEYDCQTGQIDARYYGVVNRSDAIKVLRKLQQALGRTLYGGWTPAELNQIVEESEVAQTTEREVVKDGGTTRKSTGRNGTASSRGESSGSEVGCVGTEHGQDREGGTSGTAVKSK